MSTFDIIRDRPLGPGGRPLSEVDPINVDVPVSMEIHELTEGNQYPIMTTRLKNELFNDMHIFARICPFASSSSSISTKKNGDGDGDGDGDNVVKLPSHFHALSGEFENTKNTGSNKAAVTREQWYKIVHMEPDDRRRLCSRAGIKDEMCVDRVLPSKDSVLSDQSKDPWFDGWAMFKCDSKRGGADRGSTTNTDTDADADTDAAISSAIHLVPISDKSRNRQLNTNACMDMTAVRKQVEMAEGFKGGQASYLNQTAPETLDSLADKISNTVMQQGMCKSILNLFRILSVGSYVQRNRSILTGDGRRRPYHEESLPGGESSKEEDKRDEDKSDISRPKKKPRHTGTTKRFEATQTYRDNISGNETVQFINRVAQAFEGIDILPSTQTATTTSSSSYTYSSPQDAGDNGPAASGTCRIFCVRTHVLLDKVIGGTGRKSTGEKLSNMEVVGDALRFAAFMRNSHIWGTGQKSPGTELLRALPIASSSASDESMESMMSKINVLVGDFMVMVVNERETVNMSPTTDENSVAPGYRIYCKFLSSVPMSIVNTLTAISPRSGVRAPRPSYMMDVDEDLRGTFDDSDTLFPSYNNRSLMERNFHACAFVVRPDRIAHLVVPLRDYCSSVVSSPIGHVPNVKNVREIVVDSSKTMVQDVKSCISQFFSSIKLSKVAQPTLTSPSGMSNSHPSLEHNRTAFQFLQRVNVFDRSVPMPVIHYVAEAIRVRVNDAITDRTLPVPRAIMGDLMGIPTTFQLEFWRVLLFAGGMPHLSSLVTDVPVVHMKDVNTMFRGKKSDIISFNQTSLSLANMMATASAADSGGGNNGNIPGDTKLTIRTMKQQSQATSEIASKYAIHLMYFWVAFMLRKYKPNIDNLQLKLQHERGIQYDETVYTVISTFITDYMPRAFFINPWRIEEELTFFDMRVLAPISLCMGAHRSPVGSVDISTILDILRIYVLQGAHDDTDRSIQFIENLPEIQRRLRDTLPEIKGLPFYSAPESVTAEEAVELMENPHLLAKVVAILRNNGTTYNKVVKNITQEEKEFLTVILRVHGVPLSPAFVGGIEKFFGMVWTAYSVNFGNTEKPTIDFKYVRKEFREWALLQLKRMLVEVGYVTSTIPHEAARMSPQEFSSRLKNISKNLHQALTEYVALFKEEETEIGDILDQMSKAASETTCQLNNTKDSGGDDDRTDKSGLLARLWEKTPTLKLPDPRKHKVAYAIASGIAVTGSLFILYTLTKDSRTVKDIQDVVKTYLESKPEEIKMDGNVINPMSNTTPISTQAAPGPTSAVDTIVKDAEMVKAAEKITTATASFPTPATPGSTTAPADPVTTFEEKKEKLERLRRPTCIPEDANWSYAMLFQRSMGDGGPTSNTNPGGGGGGGGGGKPSSSSGGSTKTSHKFRTDWHETINKMAKGVSEDIKEMEADTAKMMSPKYTGWDSQSAEDDNKNAGVMRGWVSDTGAAIASNMTIGGIIGVTMLSSLMVGTAGLARFGFDVYTGNYFGASVTAFYATSMAATHIARATGHKEVAMKIENATWMGEIAFKVYSFYSILSGTVMFTTKDPPTSEVTPGTAPSSAEVQGWMGSMWTWMGSWRT